MNKQDLKDMRFSLGAALVFMPVTAAGGVAILSRTIPGIMAGGATPLTLGFTAVGGFMAVTGIKELIKEVKSYLKFKKEYKKELSENSIENFSNDKSREDPRFQGREYPPKVEKQPQDQSHDNSSKDSREP